MQSERHKEKASLFLQNIKKFKQNLEKNKFAIRHSQSRIHQLSLIYFGHFEASALYFTSNKNNTN